MTLAFIIIFNKIRLKSVQLALEFSIESSDILDALFVCCHAMVEVKPKRNESPSHVREHSVCFFKRLILIEVIGSCVE